MDINSNPLNIIKIDDKKIKNLIQNYSNDTLNFFEIIEYLSPFIYSFPKLTTKSMTEDDCADFYEYIFKRMKKILARYTEKEFKFITWFSVVLRRHFFNWIKIKTENNREIAILNSPISKEIKDEIISNIVYETHHSPRENINIRNLINTLPLKYRVILKLHFFDFFIEQDIFEIIDSFGGEFNTLLANYHILLEKMKDIEKEITTLEECIGKTYNKIQDLLCNEKKEKEYKDWLNNIIEDNDDLSNKEREKHIRQIKKLKNTFLSVKPKDISDFLSITPKEAYNLLHQGKLLLKEKIKNEGIV